MVVPKERPPIRLPNRNGEIAEQPRSPAETIKALKGLAMEELTDIVDRLEEMDKRHMFEHAEQQRLITLLGDLKLRERDAEQSQDNDPGLRIVEHARDVARKAELEVRTWKPREEAAQKKAVIEGDVAEEMPTDEDEMRVALNEQITGRGEAGPVTSDHELVAEAAPTAEALREVEGEDEDTGDHPTLVPVEKPTSIRLASVKRDIQTAPPSEESSAAKAEAQRQYAVIAAQITNAEARVKEYSQGGILRRWWNKGALEKAQRDLNSAKQRESHLRAQNTWLRPMPYLASIPAEEKPKTRWSTTEPTKRIYTVAEKQVMTRYENLERGIAAKKSLVERLQREQPGSSTLTYEDNMLTLLTTEMDKLYHANKTFIDSLPKDPDEIPAEKLQRVA